MSPHFTDPAKAVSYTEDVPVGVEHPDDDPMTLVEHEPRSYDGAFLSAEAVPQELREQILAAGEPVDR